ncbi:MAG: hypothetical protein F6J97_21935 [Leptolyngbya sp. SIO4C1]|nr:hypothetical protein [Leptolyngbya sp. SIO4C1]
MKAQEKTEATSIEKPVLEVKPVLEANPVLEACLSPVTPTWLLNYQVEAALVEAVSLSVEASLQAAIEIFASQPTDHLVLVDARSETLVGVLNRQDVLPMQRAKRRVATLTARSQAQPLPQLLGKQPLWLAHQTLIEQSASCLAVVSEQGHLQGLVTRQSIAQLIPPSQLYATVQQQQQQLMRSQIQQSQLQQQYQQQLETLGTQVQSALMKEKKLEGFQKEFVTHASHQFRTPLTVIASSAGILNDFGDRLDAHKTQTHLQRIQTSINQITQMLDRLLLVDRPPTDQISCNLQTADLVQWCQTLMD